MAQSNTVSLMNTLELILHSDHSHLVHAKQQIVTLYRKVQFMQKLLQSFPENSNEEEMKLLEVRIRDSAYAIEDVVESRITEQIIPEIPKFMADYASMPDLNSEDQNVAESIEKIDSIVEELLKRRRGLKCLLPRKNLQQIGSSRRNSGIRKVSEMVGFDDDALQLKDRLTGQESKLESIPIVGMGGIGKTTLARNLYRDSLIEYYFDVRAWVTISQTYTERDVLRSLLKGIGVEINEQGGEISVLELALRLFKNLKGRRYLIVLDDLWNTDVWDDLKRVFPDDGNGSRIMLTTRLVDVAVYSTDSSSSPPLHMKLLDEAKSWELFCKEVFGKHDCPSELEEIGKMISKNCRGLPLATSVIGGLLVNSTMRRDFWEYVAQNVNSLAIKSDEHCYEILSLSYRNLPPHLKPCFLYFGLFPEDHEISVTKLVRLWIAEGFLKPERSKRLERVAKEYLEELIDRNLVFVHGKGSNGKTRTCVIHDLLRDLCIKEANKENFHRIINGTAPVSRDVPTRRIIQHGIFLEGGDKINHDFRAALESMDFMRFLLDTGRLDLSAFQFDRRFMLLRVLIVRGAIFNEFPTDILLLVNLRYLVFTIKKISFISPHISLLWKLQVLIIYEHENWLLPKIFPFFDMSHCNIDMPSEILQMTHLRHLQLKNNYFLLDCNDSLVLKDMETLSTVSDFRCTEAFVKKFPNLRKLSVYYYAANIRDWSDYHHQNIIRLSKLENLKCTFNAPPYWYLLPGLYFPMSLKKLTLSGSRLFWRHMSVIGILPHLQVLKLKEHAFVGERWEPVEGEFRRLKFLLIEIMHVEEWTAQDTHFPTLQHLIVRQCPFLREIPSGIGDIATLETINVEYCNQSAASSAMEILEEQRSLENHVLQVRVKR